MKYILFSAIFISMNMFFCSEIFAKEEKSLKKYMINDINDVNVPEYRKVFDEYILDLEYLRKHGNLPENKKKEEDLSNMKDDSVYKYEK